MSIRSIPAIADLEHHFEGILPPGLLGAWGDSARDEEAASRILAPFRREGILMVSDTAGLSKMSRERDLIDVLELIAEPKRILHGIGTAIGGAPIGVWRADNAEMLFARTISPDLVVDAMLEVQARVAERAAVKIGLCLHDGIFYELGGGLLGSDAHVAEKLAEDYAGGAETLVTDELARQLPADAGYALERRNDLDALHGSGVFSLRSSRRLRELSERSSHYPHAFSSEFFRDLAQGDRRTQLYAEHQREHFVVFLARHHDAETRGGAAAILDELLKDSIMTALVGAQIGGTKSVIEAGGGVAILVFDRGADALAFTRGIFERFHANQLEVKAGIDRGPVLLFQNDAGGFAGGAGDPINLASKISEDLGHRGRISITERAATSMGDLGDSEPFEWMASGVQIRGRLV